MSDIAFEISYKLSSLHQSQSQLKIKCLIKCLRTRKCIQVGIDQRLVNRLPKKRTRTEYKTNTYTLGKMNSHS